MELNPDFYIHCSQLAEEFYEPTARELEELGQQPQIKRFEEEFEALKADEILL
jgi:hypothetical protein